MRRFWRVYVDRVRWGLPRIKVAPILMEFTETGVTQKLLSASGVLVSLAEGDSLVFKEAGQ